jgi:hypothetical protein
VKRDVVDAIESLLAHRTEDLGCYEFVLEAWMEEAASEIKRLRSERRWIPVSERLPEVLSMVLVWSQSNGLHLASLDSYRQWRDADENPGKKITHWMPLPEPPSAL